MSDQVWQGFGFGEIGYLLIQDDIPAVIKARQMFDLIDQAYTDDVAIAAVSSMVGHQLLEIGQDGLPRPLGAAAVLSYAIAEATRWTRIGFFSESDEAVDGAVLLHAPEVTAILQPRQGGAWLMLVKAPEITDAAAVWALVSGFCETHEPASAFVDVSDSTGQATLFAERRGADVWNLALGASSLWPEQRREGVDDAVVKELLRLSVEDDLSGEPVSE